VTVGGGRVGSATHAALAVFLALALRGGFDGRVRAGAGGGVGGPDFLVSAMGVLRGDVVSIAGAGGAFCWQATTGPVTVVGPALLSGLLGCFR
jgi:hypothetical protein